jgi:hypothetical protein
MTGSQKDPGDEAEKVLDQSGEKSIAAAEGDVEKAALRRQAPSCVLCRGDADG